MNDSSFSFEKVLNDLIQLLGNELGLYRMLLEALSKERKAVLNSSIDQFTAASMEKNSLIIRMASLEKQRAGLLGLLEIHFGLSPQTLKLSRLVQIVPKMYADQLVSARRHLIEMTQKIKKANRSSERLISRALNTTRESIAFITNMIKSHSTYYATGKMDNQKASGLLMSNTI